MNWEHIHKQYKGQWIALADDETTVISSGQTAKEALDAAREEGHDDPILTRVPSELVHVVGRLEVRL